MKIDKLIIYGFGKHDNATVDFGAGMTVLYGENEAGKTTIQQFILHILFGFPQKNSALLRYEPKSGGKYGGQVHLVDERYGKCIVERVRGKSAGDVTVHFEDGTMGGEQELRSLLRHYDRISFESIFSFSLLQLQGFDKMDEEELSRTLLASGTTGVDSLLQLEKRMDKEMGELFKKSGKIPEMNVKMMELRELEIELKDAQGKVAEYAPAIQRLQEIDKQLTDLYARREIFHKQADKLAITRQLLPLHQKKMALEAKLAQLHVAAFPIDGIRRYEALVDKWTEADATKRRLTDELAQLTATMPEQLAANRLEDSEVLLAKEAEWHGWCMATASAEDELKHLTDVKIRLMGRLGVQGEQAEQRLLQANVSLQQEEEIHHLLAGLTASEQQIDYSERQLAQLENDLLAIEAKLRDIQQTMASQEELELAQRWPTIRQQLAEAKAYVAIGGRQRVNNVAVLPALLIVLAIACILVGFIQKEWLIIILGAVCGIIGAFLWRRQGSQAGDAVKMQEMERFIALYEGREQQMEQLIEHIAGAQRDKEGLQQTFADLERKHQVFVQELDIGHDDRRQLEGQLLQILQDYGFDRLPSPKIIPELLRFIRQIQEVTKDIEEIDNRQKIAQNNIDIRIQEVEKVLQKSVPQAALYEMLRREFMQLKDQTESFKSWQVSTEHKKEVMREVAELADRLQDRIQQLLAEAGVETVEAFYAADQIVQEVGKLTEQLNDIQLQLAVHGTIESHDGVTEEEVAVQLADNNSAQSVVDEQLKELINEQASLVHKTNHLLTDETYGRKLQLFEMKKAELAELAKRWSERKAIAEAIRRTMVELKEKKLPEVLTVAERLFCELTGGRYESLIVTGAGYFEAVAVDGMRYPIVELSQATKEQAYIALRLALAASILKTAPFPIIMDDPFVHFDGQRLSRMIELLNQLQEQHQFIYFTCHKEMTERWQDATIVNVSAIGSEQGVNSL
ncbi:ATP-binding protein [Sporosarcina beigongshangi]|uniref:ATP-binding protein n=1 Tax=Sporosarcina beigongshangi TaxID=2782538 RepID=UPI001939F5F1|nr:AAA family ATPase [Sporosarcina beigongshangi]